MGSTEVAASRLLESLPARPPTPPRETNHEPELPLKSVLLGGCSLPTNPGANLQTPPSIHSPNTGVSSGGSRKKVEFSAQAEYKEAPVYIDDNASLVGKTRSPLRIVVIPPSSSASRPTKSILKVTSYEPSKTTAPVAITDMLASTVQQLAGSDRDSKLDAYLMLARALKASDNLPDRIALQSKMTLFTQFIQRDVTAAKTSAGTLDSTLVVAALDLLNTFLRFPAIASTVPSDFGIFIIDHCIRCFEVSDVPRDVLRTLMRVVAVQSFPSKVMTSDRVGRLVSTLHNMKEQLESKNTVLLRSFIYRTLVRDHKMLMAVHADWIPDLFTDMLSTVPYIRDAAIGLGLDAGFSIGRERPASQRVMELFQTTVENEKYFEYYTKRLQAMTKDRAESFFVPQVWSVATLFLRSVDKWHYFKPWLHIIQGCFNSGDLRTKEEANSAWSRFTYALLRDNRRLPRKLLTILTQAPVSQLRRRSVGPLRRAVVGCVCNLFYYTLRPNIEYDALDSAWDNSLKPVIGQLLEKASTDDAKEREKANQATACAILTGLINCSTPRPWKEDHVIKTPLVAPEDLPAVDPKWIRRNSSRVFALVGPILERSFLELSTPRSATQTLWRAVVGAVAVAAAKEVKVSAETAVFVGHAFSLLLKLWTSGVPTPSEGNTNSSANDADTSFVSAQFLAATREFLLTMVDALGPLPFTEKQFSKDAGNAFVPVGTPSQRAGKGHSLVRSPLHHLFSILSTLPPGVQDDDAFADFVESVLAPFFSAKSVRGRRILALEMLQTAPVDALCPYGPWQVVAAQIVSSMHAQSSGSGGGNASNSGSGNGSGSGSGGSGHYNSLGSSYNYLLSPSSASADTTPIGHDFREVVRVLERGLRSTPMLPFERWQALFHTLHERVQEEAGYAGLALCVLEPLAKTIVDHCAHPCATKLSPTALRATVALISTAVHPRDRQAIEAAKRRLWGSAIAVSGPSAPFDPFNHLYKAAKLTLHQLYAEYDAQNTAVAECATSLLNELVVFFNRCQQPLFVKSLAAVQDGLICWIQDADTKLGRLVPAAEATNTVWNTACTLLQRTPDSDTFPFADFEPLLCAAFSSKHLSVVNTTLGMWNEVFGGHVGEIEYPEKLKTTLVALQPFIDVTIPGLEMASLESDGAQKPMFVDSQDDMAFSNLLSTTLNSREITTPKAAASAFQVPSPAAIPLTLSAKRQAAPLATTTPSSVNSSSRRKSGKGKRKALGSKPPRPRHEDSQIEFTTIDSAAEPPSSDVVTENSHSNDAMEVMEESQILTERQKEVRDRQRETSALYSDIFISSPAGAAATVARKRSSRSSPYPSVPAPQPMQEEAPAQPEQQEQQAVEGEQELPPSSPIQEDVALPEQVQAVTPEHVHLPSITSGEFVDEDFIASTPTPRRGQTLTIPVNDNDPPSSPPEPRRYPLLPEISSRLRSSNILDEWHFSSSPTGGSPIAARHTAPEPELSLAGAIDGGDLVDGEDDVQHDVLSSGVFEMTTSQLTADEDVTMEDVATSDLPAFSSSQRLTIEMSPLAHGKAKAAEPSTPKRSLRHSGGIQEAESFADTSTASLAPPPTLPRTLRDRQQKKATRGVTQSSPVRSSSRPRTKRMAMPLSSIQDQSFLISDGDERSMLRLAAELESRRWQSSPAAKGASASQGSSNGGVGLHDCITVSIGDDEEEEEEEGNVPSSQASTQSASNSPQKTPTSSRRRKRKRTTVLVEDAVVGNSRSNRRCRRAKHQKGEGKAAASQESAGKEEKAAELVLRGKNVEEVVPAAEADEAMADDAMRSPTADDREVQSQLTLELQALSRRSASAGGMEQTTTVVDLTAESTESVQEVIVGRAVEAVTVAPGDDEADRPAKKPKLAGILSLLKSSLGLLRTAALSRDEVHEIEDVCMDVKRALYDAEARGRQ